MNKLIKNKKGGVFLMVIIVILIVVFLFFLIKYNMYQNRIEEISNLVINNTSQDITKYSWKK